MKHFAKSYHRLKFLRIILFKMPYTYSSTISEAALRIAITKAYESVTEEIDKLSIALSRNFFECTDDFTLGPDSIPHDDIDLQYSGIGDVGLILDTSIWAVEDDIYQQQLASALALQLDIW